MEKDWARGTKRFHSLVSRPTAMKMNEKPLSYSYIGARLFPIWGQAFQAFCRWSYLINPPKQRVAEQNLSGVFALTSLVVLANSMTWATTYIRIIRMPMKFVLAISCLLYIDSQGVLQVLRPKFLSNVSCSSFAIIKVHLYQSRYKLWDNMLLCRPI